MKYLLILLFVGVIGLVLSIMAYYQRKLKRLQGDLENQVNTKTKELREINESLEHSVQEKEQELIQKDKILTLQSKQAVMGEMMSMIAHQWRQPLSTITLQISNLEINRMFGKVVDKKQEEDTLRQISDTVMYLSDTIDDFQTYFRADKISEKIEMHELLQKVVKFALPRVEGKAIDLEIKKLQDIYADVCMNQLVQVLLNILNNAIDSFEGVQKENKHVSLYVKEKEDTIEIVIEDNGCGIQEENLAKLFEPYFSTKGKNGTGLGLSMSKKIIEKQFNGKIEVESSPEGTAFIVTIMKKI